MSTVSEKIAEWVVATNYSDIPQDVISAAKRCIMDLIGVTIAGIKEPVAQIIDNYLEDVKCAEQSTTIGLGTKTSAVEAALANGLIGHCLDYDDLIIPVAGGGGPHITAAIFPAALALAEKEKKSGRDLIEAYVLGCEVCYRVGLGVEPTSYQWGWHNTETHGIFGATVAASKLLGLSSEQITMALGIAGSEASGMQENFGTMTKPFHAGQSAAKGIRAALLAKLGFTSAKTIFEGRTGFCNLFTKDARIDKITSNLGEPFCVPDICLKLYPCCGGSHPAIFAMLELVKKEDIKPEDIEAIEAKCPPLTAHVLRYDKPQTAFEGKFSMQFPLTLVAFERRVALPEFTDEKVKEPQIISMMSKVKLITLPELQKEDPESAIAIVEIRLKDGRQLVNRCDYRPGGPRNPIPPEELLEKYRSCARLVLPEKQVEESAKLLTDLEKVDDLSKLVKNLHL